MIDRILERIKKAKEIGNSCIGCDYKENCIPSNCEKRAFDLCTEIVCEVAKEYEEKKYYRITLSCLEDSTNLEMPLTKQEYLLLTRISDLVYRVATGCMPTMYVEQKGE